MKTMMNVVYIMDVLETNPQLTDITPASSAISFATAESMTPIARGTRRSAFFIIFFEILAKLQC